MRISDWVFTVLDGPIQPTKGLIHIAQGGIAENKSRGFDELVPV